MAQILHTMQLTNAFKIGVITRNILEWIIKCFEGTSTYHCYRLLLFLLGFLWAGSELGHRAEVMSLLHPSLCLRMGSQWGLQTAGWAEGPFAAAASSLTYRRNSRLPFCSCTQECTWKQPVRDLSLSPVFVSLLAQLLSSDSSLTVNAYWAAPVIS